MKVIFGLLWLRLHVKYFSVVANPIKKHVVGQKHLKLTSDPLSVLVEFVDRLAFKHSFGVPPKCANITDVLGTTLIFIDNQLSHVTPGALFFSLSFRVLYK